MAEGHSISEAEFDKLVEAGEAALDADSGSKAGT